MKSDDVDPIRSVVFHSDEAARHVILVVGVPVPPTVTRKLMSEGFALARVATAAEVHAFMAERLPVAVLLNGTHSVDALAIVPTIREHERFAFVQILISPAPKSIAAAIRDGVDDVFDAIDDDAADRIVARVHCANVLARLALLDPLTQLHNRRFMNDRLQAEVARAVRERTSFFEELKLARADGTYPRLLTRFARVDVLVIDDFAIQPITDAQRSDLLEVLEDRYGTRSTIVTSQLDPKNWHDYLADPSLADAICDRLLSNAHRLVLKGPSRRKEKQPQN